MSEEAKNAARLIINSLKKIVEKGDIEEVRYLLESPEIQETLPSCHVTDYDDFMEEFVCKLQDKVEGFSFHSTDLMERYNDLVYDYQDSLYICESLCLAGSLTILRQIYTELSEIRQTLVDSLMVPETSVMYKTLVDNNLPF